MIPNVLIYLAYQLMVDKRHRLKVESKSGRKVEEIDLLEIAAHFFLKELDKIKPIGKIRGEILVVDEILSESVSDLLHGDMMEIKNHYVDKGVKKNYYVCRIADFNNSAETIRTLAHELVHVWQTENGSMVTTDDGEWFWYGKSYGTLPYNGSDSDLLLPWEVEADTLDIEITRKFYMTYFSNW